MIVLLMVTSFIIGYVDRTCQSFLSGCLFVFFQPDLIIMGFDLSLPVGDKFFL